MGGIIAPTWFPFWESVRLRFKPIEALFQKWLTANPYFFVRGSSATQIWVIPQPAQKRPGSIRFSFLGSKHPFICCSNLTNEYPRIFFISGCAFLSCHGLSSCVPSLTNRSVRYTVIYRSPIGTSQITTHRYSGTRYPHEFNAGWSKSRVLRP